MIYFLIINFSLIYPILAPGIIKGIRWSSEGNSGVPVAWLMPLLKGQK